jgi:tRNA threonylcarbamoyladenosine biosynthesis protein TsaB
MRVLALDTTTRAGSLALSVNGEIVEEYVGDASRTHGERLPGDLFALLGRHRLVLADVDLFGLAAGPGSFTGLRIGIATIQGLAFATRRPVVAVSALDALARRMAPLVTTHVFGTWMDAQRREVFAQLWSGAPAALRSIEEATVGAPAAILERWLRTVDAPITLVGDGARAYRGIAAMHADRVIVRDEMPPLAGEIAQMAAEQARDGTTIGPGAIQPIYIRRPDAELARERRA